MKSSATYEEIDERAPCFTVERQAHHGHPTVWRFHGPHRWVNSDDGWDDEAQESYEITICEECGSTFGEAREEVEMAHAAAALLAWLLRDSHPAG